MDFEIETWRERFEREHSHKLCKILGHVREKKMNETICKRCRIVLGPRSM